MKLFVVTAMSILFLMTINESSSTEDGRVWRTVNKRSVILSGDYADAKLMSEVHPYEEKRLRRNAKPDQLPQKREEYDLDSYFKMAEERRKQKPVPA